MHCAFAELGDSSDMLVPMDVFENVVFVFVLLLYVTLCDTLLVVTTLMVGLVSSCVVEEFVVIVPPVAIVLCRPSFDFGVVSFGNSMSRNVELSLSIIGNCTGDGDVCVTVGVGETVGGNGDELCDRCVLFSSFASAIDA